MGKPCPRFKLVNVLSDDEAEGCEKGFIIAELIKKYAPARGECSVFLCGPQAMYDFVDREIAKLGLRQKFIRHELFGEYRTPEKSSDYPAGAIGRQFKSPSRYAIGAAPSPARPTRLCSTPWSAMASPLRRNAEAGIAAGAFPACSKGRCTCRGASTVDAWPTWLSDTYIPAVRSRRAIWLSR